MGANAVGYGIYRKSWECPWALTRGKIKFFFLVIVKSDSYVKLMVGIGPQSVVICQVMISSGQPTDDRLIIGKIIDFQKFRLFFTFNPVRHAVRHFGFLVLAQSNVGEMWREVKTNMADRVENIRE